MDGSAPRVARAAARAFVCSGARRRRRSDRSYVPAGIPRRGPGAARGTHVSLACPERARARASQIAVDTRPGFYPDERVLWLAEHGALVFGDSLPGGPVPDDWLPEGQTRADYRSWLLPLLALPVELVLPTHGDPGGRDLLELALAP
jgi:hypothetical protein